ncbi:RING-H2 finger ATL81-like [Olea europaea subsp. europaea]|uniref:RING-H2 finger ATL81-like n=1 Tax=Olea europaea subsp. europaea TaxID=158383 RepID=A0A8S0TMR8_OLEEU|nr:RING-H2 finger ATL81-like [Olea europaea subsp. europaea]
MASYGRYHYEYQLCRPEGILPWRIEREIERKRKELSLPLDTYGVYCIFKVRFILKKRPGQGADEILSHAGNQIWLPWDYLTGMYDFNMIFIDFGLREDLKEELVSQLRDFANQLRADPSNAGCYTFQIVVSIQIYTVQQEDETIEAAKDRAITRKILEVEFLMPDMLNRKFRFGYLPGKWSFIDSLAKVKVEDNKPGQACLVGDECCICLNGPAAGEEISSLPCSHAYHSECIITWLLRNPTCPMCYKPVPRRSNPWD